jgi:N-methylhydantoinase B
MWGGRSGETAEYLLRLPTDEAFQPIDQVMRKVPAGSEVIVLTGGGGGWGPPQQRDPAAVLEDVRQGIVSIGAAQNHYGVVIRGSELDRVATEKLRATHRHN